MFLDLLRENEKKKERKGKKEREKEEFNSTRPVGLGAGKNSSHTQSMFHKGQLTLVIWKIWGKHNVKFKGKVYG